MIDARAVIDPSASIDEGVSVGPYSVVGADVEIGRGTSIGPHVTINGPMRIGQDNRIHAYASLGDAPQDLTYAGEPTRVEVGDRNIVREFCTINRGTARGEGVTRIGDDNFIMAYCHIAHDCRVGSHTLFANGASLAGHVIVEDYAYLSGFVLVHQFVSIGAYCFCAMGSGIAKDVPPYCLVAGNPAKPHGLNSVGLERRGFTPEVLRQLRKAYKLLYKSHLKLGQAVAELELLAAESEEVARMVAFLKSSRRSIVR